jgi:hypothetical protein
MTHDVKLICRLIKHADTFQCIYSTITACAYCVRAHQSNNINVIINLERIIIIVRAIAVTMQTSSYARQRVLPKVETENPLNRDEAMHRCWLCELHET